MITKSFYYTSLALRVIEKIIGSKFSVSGIENIPNHPVLFVANHFTRSETFFVPYLIHKHTNRQVRCLADSSLYVGALGRFLESVGTISTKNANRDKIILKDLISGDNDWMIYPEGSMVKSKEIKLNNVFVNYTPNRVGPVRTGSAVLALKSEIYRHNMVNANKNNNTSELKNIEDEIGVGYQEFFKDISTCIIPVSITYYPIRPGENKIQQLAKKLIKKIPRKVSEELEIEGNLLLESEINIHFGKAINLSKYTLETRNLISQIPIISSETKTNLILRYLKSKLTNEFMEKIYSDIQINLDHIFSATIHYFNGKEISIDHLKRIIYLSAVMIQKTKKYRINHSIYEENLFKIFNDEPHLEFDSVFQLAINQGIIKKEKNIIKIEKKLFKKKYDFHEIRIENTLEVIANEFFLLDVPSKIVQRNSKLKDEVLRKKVFDEIYQSDIDNFSNDYRNYFDEKFSKDKSVGSPFYLHSKQHFPSKIKRIGFLLCHGYKSAPKEVEDLAKFLNNFGFKVYGARLQGHGTAPINLKDTTWNDWYNSLQRGYSALNNVCSKIVMVGFSTGGLLSLVSSSNKNNNFSKLAGIVSINSALKLLDIKARMVPGINIWNEMLEKFHIEKGRFEYVDDKPENPHINYSRNYIKAVNELEKLMNICDENLHKVIHPTLVIQGKGDPVVNPVSGKIIYEKINSNNKNLLEVNSNKHVIITCEGKENIFLSIKQFLDKLEL